MTKELSMNFTDLQNAKRNSFRMNSLNESIKTPFTTGTKDGLQKLAMTRGNKSVMDLPSSN